MVIKTQKEKTSEFGLRIFPQWNIIDRKHWKRVYKRDGLFEFLILKIGKRSIWIFRNKRIYNEQPQSGG